jgi:glutamate carboxypeptidase
VDVTKLPFDTEAMLAGLKPWVECESPTWDAARVGAMMDVAARDLAILGARIERIGGRLGFGDCVPASPPAMRQDPAS